MQVVLFILLTPAVQISCLLVFLLYNVLSMLAEIERTNMPYALLD